MNMHSLSETARALVARPKGILAADESSGGQEDEEATANLDAVNRLAQARGAPWELSFSFGRGLQTAALDAWRGDPKNRAQAQAVLLERVRATGAARMGRYGAA